LMQTKILQTPLWTLCSQPWSSYERRCLFSTSFLVMNCLLPVRGLGWKAPNW
jgi:hypothetical protein